MKSNNSFIKNIIIGLTLLSLVFVLFLSIEIVNETHNWVYFDIDYREMSDEISAYGTLIGGVLSFLSVLFVLYNIYEVRGQLESEKREKENEEKDKMLNKLKLISNVLIVTTDEIKSQGQNMKTFYEIERIAPSEMHQMYWNTNKHFGRLMNMDFEEMYKAFETFFKNDLNWNKTFLNLYNLNDYYGEALKELKEKYTEQIHYKVSEQKLIGARMDEVQVMASDLIDDYKSTYGNTSYLTFPWSIAVNQFVTDYYTYLEQKKVAGEVPDLRYISDNIYLPFLREAMRLRAIGGYDTFGVKNIVKLMVKVRRNIDEVETYCLQYADDVEKQYETYFSEDNETIKVYIDLKKKLDEKIAESTRS